MRRYFVFLVLALLLCGRVMATEPHFDLPKKDAKEQCAEMQRASDECGYDKRTKVSDNLYSCGNIYIKLLEIGDPFWGPLGTVIMVLDTKQNPIGIQEDYENAIIFGDYNKHNFIILPQNDTMLTSQEDMLTYKKYHKKVAKSKIQIKINNCYVTQLIEK